MRASREEADRPAGQRTYDGRLRRRQADRTRTEILEAAARLFTELGWTGTSMRAIAAEAGVAVETVYSSVGSKGAVLLAALQASAAEDDPAVPIAERPEIVAVGEGDFAQRAATGAALAAAGIVRTVGMHKAFQDGAAADPSLAEPFAAYVAWRREIYQVVAELVHGGPIPRLEAEGLWAVLSRDVYVLLVDQCGWTYDEYVAWTRSMIVRVLGPTAAR